MRAALAALLILTACTGRPQPSFCPEQVFPSDAALDWFAATATPPAVDDYLARLEKQQRVIAEACP